MTTPDIEKLRGLLAEWHIPDVHNRPWWTLFAVRELETAGLPELLADYERLLRERGGMVSE